MNMLNNFKLLLKLTFNILLSPYILQKLLTTLPDLISQNLYRDLVETSQDATIVGDKGDFAPNIEIIYIYIYILSV